jgi:hypothetical protein
MEVFYENKFSYSFDDCSVFSSSPALCVYCRKILLAHIYAWKLNETERALKIYEEVIQLKKVRKERIRIPALELLYVAELYEAKNDFKMAEKTTWSY